MRRRLPPVSGQDGLIHLRPFLKPALFLFTLAGFFCFLGLYACTSDLSVICFPSDHHLPVLTYIEPAAIFVGIDADKAFYLLSIANASSALGRICSGIAADRFGSLTVIIPMTALAGVLQYAWPFVHSYGGYVGLAIVYGAGCGTYVALLVAPTIALGELNDVGRRVGTFMTLLAFGALAGPPVSGAIESGTHGFKAVGYYAGSMVMIAVAIMIGVRWIVLGGWKGKF
jgi:MFS transporter, MCT family, solute carrier family 16 (monocarboxylic acid transporters), member 10